MCVSLSPQTLNARVRIFEVGPERLDGSRPVGRWVGVAENLPAAEAMVERLAHESKVAVAVPWGNDAQSIWDETHSGAPRPVLERHPGADCFIRYG